MLAARLLAILAALAISAFVALTTAHADRQPPVPNLAFSTPGK